MKICTTFEPTEQERNLLKDRFRQYELSVYPGLPSEEEDQLVFSYLKNTDGEFCGGIEANIYWDAIEIETLWISENLRGTGLGSKLMDEIETVAVSKGARLAFLKTFDARQFYEKRGYEVFGVLEGRPVGTKLFHMKKQLVI